MCKECNKSFSSVSNLNHHKKRCKNKKNEDDVNALLLKQENEYLKKTIEEKDKILEKQKKDVDYLQSTNIETTKLARTTAKASMNAITYAASVFNAANAMNNLACDEVQSIFNKNPIVQQKIKDIKPPNKKEDCMPEHLIGLHRDNKFIEYLFSIIKEAYKSADPTKQSFWATDTSRLVYIVRELIHTKAEWIYDKKGNRIKESIIDPLIDEVIDIVEQYRARMNKYLYANRKIISDDYRMEKLKIMANTENMLTDFKTNKSSIKNQLVRLLAPIFYLDKSNIKMIENKEMTEDSNYDSD